MIDNLKNNIKINHTPKRKSIINEDETMTITGGGDGPGISLFFDGTLFKRRRRLTDGELAQKFREERELYQQHAKTREALIREGIQALVAENIAQVHFRRQEYEEEERRDTAFLRDAKFSFDFALYGGEDAVIITYQAKMSPRTRKEIERKGLEMIKGEKTLVGIEAMLKQVAGDYHETWLQQRPQWLENPRNARNKGYLQDLLPRVEAVFRQESKEEIEQRYGIEFRTEARRIRTPPLHLGITTVPMKGYTNIVTYHVK